MFATAALLGLMKLRTADTIREPHRAMPHPALSIAGVRAPHFLYGTAWKEERTQRLVGLALQQGFRGIDTANQRKHYHEAAVGQAVAAALGAGLLKREDLFLQ